MLKRYFGDNARVYLFGSRVYAIGEKLFKEVLESVGDYKRNMYILKRNS
jgi:hypothetical protein